MKNLLLLAMAAMLITGCSLKATTPYGQIETETDSQIFTYTDADVRIKDGTVRSDDTTVIIVGVKDNTGADLEQIFNHSMSEIRKIFEARKTIYKEWVGGD